VARALAICEMDHLCTDDPAEAGSISEPGRLEQRAG
jgi:hypothetical protein